jgi:hypothetical protein
MSSICSHNCAVRIIHNHGYMRTQMTKLQHESFIRVEQVC